MIYSAITGRKGVSAMQLSNEATFRLNEGSCEVDTIDRMESLASRIGNKRLPCAKLVKANGLSSKVVPV